MIRGKFPILLIGLGIAGFLIGRVLTYLFSQPWESIALEIIGLEIFGAIISVVIWFKIRKKLSRS